MKEQRLGGLIKRLREDHDRMTQGQLAAYADVPREWLSLVETDKIKEPDRDRLARMARVLRVPSEVLLGAAGYDVAVHPVPERTPEELARELQGAIHRRDQEHRELRRRLEESPIRMEVLSGTMSAGTGAPSEPEYIAYWPAAGERGHHFVGVEVVGDCMVPKILPGQIAVVDLDGSPRPGNIVAAEHDGSRIVKTLEERRDGLWLVAIQGQVPIKVDEQTRIMGVVRGSYQRF